MPVEEQPEKKGIIMAFPSFSMSDLIEAGVHFGHKTRRWNPGMAPYIYGVRNDTHIIDLGQTVPMLHRALKAARDVAASGGKVLFVGTKRQASDIIAETAKRCGQFYINQRWLGGLLTNWETIQGSIRRLNKLEQILSGNHVGLTKKELLGLERQRQKLEKSLGGIKDMGGQPNLIFIIDTTKEDLAVKEAQKLNIPTVAVVDTNAEITGITYPIPGNDDATRAIRMYCDLIAEAILDGRAEAPQPVFRAPKAKEVKENTPQADASAEQAKGEKKELAKKDGKKDTKAEAKKPAQSTTKKAAMAELAKKAADDTEQSEEAVAVAVEADAETPEKKSAKAESTGKKKAS
jgi:small subunit ribosomal protein S2